MRHLAEACEAIASTTKKLVKTGIVADYLKSRSIDKAAVSAVFLSGRPFPAMGRNHAASRRPVTLADRGGIVGKG